jgi:hypothetical protein
MSTKQALITILITGITAYFIGNFMPIKALVPNIDWDKKISSGELFYYSICFIQAIGTIAAVLVALFSENIKGYFRKPVLSIDLHNKELMEELDNNGEKNRKAKRYHNSIDVFNKGNINAESCEIYIDSILFVRLGMNTPIELLQNEHILYWSGNEQRNNTYIPLQGKKSFQIFEIFPPEEQGTPGGGDTATIPPKLVIGSYKIPDEYCGGKWEVKICLYTPTLKPQKFKVTIEWDGSWENRQMEMKSKVTNKIELI